MAFPNRAYIWLALWFGLSLLPELAPAQDDRPVRISRLRGEIADRFEIDPKELQLNVPPTADIFPGAIVCVDTERGIEIIDRLPEELANGSSNRPSTPRSVIWPKLQRGHCYYPVCFGAEYLSPAGQRSRFERSKSAGCRWKSRISRDWPMRSQLLCRRFSQRQSLEPVI